MQNNIISMLLDYVHEKKNYSRGEFIYMSGNTTEKMGIVLSGSIQIEQNDFWGNRTIIDRIEAGGFFAETYAITGEPLMVDVEVIENCEIAYINLQQILNSSDIQSKIQLSQILVKICSTKNLKLSQKIMFTSPKTIRSRLNAFLTYQSKINNSKEFYIPFDRQQLADYLNLERSALSGELSKMVKEGLIETKKNHFILKK